MALSRKAKIFQITTSVIFITIAAVAIFQRQAILDWWTLRNYTPASAVAQLADQSTMTDTGKRIFYLNDPKIQDKASFYNSCKFGENTIVLGCYTKNDGIFVLKVDDPRLSGVEQVTAAHEMLHAAYDRLSTKEKVDIDNQLNTFYNTLQDAEVRSKIELYRKNGANITNELHSILGTEVETLTPALEKYYAKYFANRSKVVAYTKQYENEFISRKNKVADLDSQLSSIEQKVVANNAELNAQQQSINAESDRLDSLLRSGNVEAYNAAVPAYNRRIPAFNALVSQTEALVARYKEILTERNKIAVEAQELNKALNSSIQSASDPIQNL
jgi:predicted transcriptional regulator